MTFAARNDEIHFGVGRNTRVEMETPCELRPGRFDIGRIGAFTYLGGGRSVIREVEAVGRFTAIAPDLQCGSPEHRVGSICSHPIFEGTWGQKWDEVADFYAENPEHILEAQKEYRRDEGSPDKKILIGNSVWIGGRVTIRRGISIGNGAIIAAGSVVTKDVPAYTVVGGVPARSIRPLFTPEIIQELERLRWWDYGLAALRGVQLTKLDVNSAETALRDIRKNIREQRLRPIRPKVIAVLPDNTCEELD
ncbi:putative O-acetyltransferase [Salipiger mucosus DSM 16094]|uniref:Putative O-acetyltransferase n=1 Tax=Salipiger mucosus DSM 16094 TaxID=1123237 RepID=S9QDI4_9RHOB|nr:putative O-acetyltransferase [Salipiger mucosus DSM 16094]